MAEPCGCGRIVVRIYSRRKRRLMKAGDIRPGYVMARAEYKGGESGVHQGDYKKDLGSGQEGA